MNDLLFPPLPNSIRVSFTRPKWNLFAIKLNYFLPGLKKRVCAELRKIGLQDVTLVNSGTSALLIALQEVGVSKGDEVVLPSFVCKAVVHAVLAAGATPVYADIDDDFNSTPKMIGAALTKKTKAVIAVHQYGKLCDIRGIQRLCKKHRIILIEDAAIPIGIKDGNRFVGSFGDYAIFSFNVGKTIVSFGGGVLVRNRPGTSHETLPNARFGNSNILFFLTNIYYKPFFVRIFNLLRRLGLVKRQENIKQLYEQTSSSSLPTIKPTRMSRVQLAATLYQLQNLTEILTNQREIAETYTKLLAKTPLHLPAQEGNTFTYYPVRAPKRYELSLALAKAGIETQWTFYPLHLQKKFSQYKGKLPNTSRLWKEELSLPIGPCMTRKQARFVCEQVSKFYAEN